jgi:hypothetical protein
MHVLADDAPAHCSHHLPQARRAHPGVEFSIAIAAEQLLLLPKDSDRLWRSDAQGRLGFYRVHVYRDCEVNEVDALQSQVYVVPLLTLGVATAADSAATYIGDLTTGSITTAGPGVD